MARVQNWVDALPIVLLGLRNLPNDTGYSPSVAVTGRSLLMPSPFIDNNDKECTSETVRDFAKQMSTIDFHEMSYGRPHSVPKSYIPRDLQSCTHVWVRVDRVRRPLEAPYTGPFLIKKRQPKYFTLETNTGASQTVSIDRLKPAIIPSSTGTPVQETSPSLPESPARLEPETSLSDQSIEKTETPAVQVEKQSRSGRKIKFRTYNDYHYF